MTHQTAQIGKTSFKLLLKQIKGSTEIEKKIIPCILTVRGSSVKKAAGNQLEAPKTTPAQE